MAWVFGIVVVVVFALYIWAVASTRREITMKIQPVIDDLFDLDKTPRK